MSRSRFVPLLALALLASACGTRAEFAARPVGLRTTTVTETIDPTTGAVSGPSAAAGARAVRSFRDGPVRLRAGSGIRNGTIKIGGLFPMSGGLSALGVPPAKAARAYFQHVNDTGGINGLKIDFDICDDKADPNRSASCTDKLVADGAFIMGPSFTPFSSNVVPMLARKGVPWIGYDGINVEGFDSPLVVTVGAPIQTMAHALLPYWYRQVEARKGVAPKRIGVVYLDQAPSRTYLAEAKNVICPRLGCTIAVEQRITFFDLDYSSVCLKMRSENVDAVWIVTDPASAVKLLVQCRELKYKPAVGGFLGQHGVYMDLTMEQSGAWADGMLANSALLPPSVDAPANREMKRIVGRYEKDVDYGYFTALGYASARMTVDVIRRALTIDATLPRRALLRAASQIKHYGCHGLCKDVDLTARSGGNHNIWMVRSRFDRSADDQWELDGGPVDAWRAETWRGR